MLTPIPSNVKADIVTGVKDKFNTDIEEDIIDFLLDFQFKVFVDEGFAKSETVKYNYIGSFKYDTKRVDSKATMKRLLNKHGDNYDAAITEFRALGKSIAIQLKEDRRIAIANKPAPALPLKRLSAISSLQLPLKLK